ncbi:MAG: helix-turn-helix domain-containing protein [Pseudonocardia sp.]|nr:helix-turn-helix domain-containing protein [Pseudonocardia sp.]
MTRRKALLGREKEIEAVRRFLEAAAVDGQALLFTGPAGIGQTALLDAALTMAADAGAVVVRATGAADETDLPFAGLSQLLAPLDAVVERLAPGHRAVLSTVLGHDDGQADPVAVVAALVAALEVAAGSGFVVVGVDDLTLVDGQSVGCLRRLAGVLAGRRIGLLATAETGAGGGLPELRLAPLDDEACAGLLDARAPRPARTDRERLLREAEGNPLALQELPLRAGDPPGPRLGSLFRDQVAALPAAGRRLLLLAALADTPDLDVVLGAGVPVPEELRRAEHAGLVALAARSVRFAHPGVRAAVTAAATAAERRGAHAVLAGRVDRPDRRLWHRSEAATDPDAEIARELEAAAAHLLHRGDTAAATAALRRSAELTPPGAVRARRTARAVYVDAAIGGDLDVVGTQLDRGPGSLWSAAARGHLLLHGDGDLDAAHRVLVDAVEAVGAAPGSEPAALTAALDTLLVVCRFAGREQLWPSWRALSARHGAPTPAEPTARGAPSPSDPLDPVAAVRTGWSALAVDRVGRHGPALRRVLDDGLQGGAAGAAISAALLLMLDAFAAGRWDEADRLAGQGQALCAARGHEAMAMLTRAGPALVAACRGDEVACREHTSAMIGWAAPRGARLVHHYAAHARVLAALGAGDTETAYHRACTVTRPGTVEQGAPGSWMVMDLVEAAVRTQRLDEAVAHVRAAEEAGIAGSSDRSELLVAAAAALVEQGEQATARYERSLAAPGATAWPFDVARVRLAYGEHLRRSRATSAARLQLTTALATFRLLGADPWISRAESELQAAGHRTSRARGPVPTVLSHQERTVAGLAATGVTNRQIGERLGLSPRTVGSHLSRVFQKLGVSSRAALGEALRVADPD